MTGLRRGSKDSSRSRELAAHTTGHGDAGNMYSGRPSLAEKEIKHDPGVYVFTSSWALACKKRDEIFDIPFFRHYVCLDGYANLTPGHVRRLPYLQHRLRGLLRSISGGSIPGGDQ